MPIKREGERERQREKGAGGGQHLQHVTQPPKWPSWPIGQSDKILLWFYFWQTASPSLAPPPLPISKLPLRLRHSSQGSSSFPIPRFDVLFTAVSLLDSCSETCHATAMCKQETCAWAEWGKTTVNLKLKLLSLCCCCCCAATVNDNLFFLWLPLATRHMRLCFSFHESNRACRARPAAPKAINIKMNFAFRDAGYRSYQIANASTRPNEVVSKLKLELDLELLLRLEVQLQLQLLLLLFLLLELRGRKSETQ